MLPSTQPARTLHLPKSWVSLLGRLLVSQGGSVPLSPNSIPLCLLPVQVQVLTLLNVL